MNVAGTKLVCATCGSTAVVTKGGAGELQCHGAAMTVQAGAGERRVAPAPTGGDHYDPFYD